MISWGYMNFFLRDEESLSNNLVGKHGSDGILDIILGALSAIGYLAKENDAFYMHMLILVVVLTMWTTVDEFVAPLKPDGWIKVDEVVSQYESVKKLCNLFNNTLWGLWRRAS